jgi:hypothetical protein
LITELAGQPRHAKSDFSRCPGFLSISVTILPRKGGSGKSLSGACESEELPVGARDSFHWQPVVQSFPNSFQLERGKFNHKMRLFVQGQIARFASTFKAI